MPNMSKKTKLAYWMVSHCETDNKREDYVKKLQKYIPIDIFGQCGKPIFQRSGNGKALERKKFIPNYKFYLAFENSFCKDYVTEKFWNHLGKLLNFFKVFLRHTF